MKTTVLGTGAALIALGFVATGPAAYAAAEGDVEVVNTETIQVYVGSDGDIQSQRVYEQLTATGSGSVELANPIEESGLRNLDGFSGISVEDGVQNIAVDVDGVERMRSVSDYEGDLPLDISVEYKLDGARVNPSDVVGADGELEVLYTVKNVTAQPQEVTFTDGSGGTVTETVDVPIPMVGSLSTVAPPGFTDVRSEQANMAGDGKGGTKLSFTMTLFPPLGSDEVQFGYTAIVDDAVVPPSSVSALPVNPLESTSFKTAGESYKSGSDTGVRLAEGATEIDANLLKLQDGAATLLAGLIKLSDGADQLNAGLAGEAAPGAVQLADGAVVLKDGLGQIDDGAGRLADGAGRLASGSGEALTGSQKLEDGLGQISDGLGQLAEVDGLPKALRGVKALQKGVDEILAGFGSANVDGTLLNGLKQLEIGLGELETGSGDLAHGLRVLKGEVPAESPGLLGAKGGVDKVEAGLTEAVKPGSSLDQLIGGLNLVMGTDCGPTCQGIISQQILPRVEGSKTSLTEARDGLGQVSGGLALAIGGLDQKLIPGANKINGGITQAKNGVIKASGGAQKLKAGTVLVSGGLRQLEVGLTTAVSGVFQLADGAGAAHAGSSDLADGLGEIADGSGELAAGAGELAAGTGDASDGSQRLADGAGELADGLGDAADGSGQLADGTAKAAEGAPQIVDGAGRLSEEGMSQLIGAGQDTAQDYGKLYATIAAGGERADAEKMAYGAPEGATGVTAYTYELLGEDGESGRNMTRGLGALVLLGLGGAAFALRRRFV